MDELAWLAADFDKGLREQLDREDDVKAAKHMGRLWRATTAIGAAVLAWCGIVAVYAGLMLALSGCGESPAESRYAEMSAELSEKRDSFSDTEHDATCEMSVEVRAREGADPRFAEFPSTCVLKFGANYCGPCRNEPITAWLRASEWTVVYCDCERNPALAEACDVTSIPTFVVLRYGREVARYTGTSIEKFLPILKAACK